MPHATGDQAKPGKGPTGFGKKGLVAVKRVWVGDTQGAGGIEEAGGGRECRKAERAEAAG